MKYLKILFLLTIFSGSVNAFNIQPIEEKYPEFDRLDVTVTKMNLAGGYTKNAGTFTPVWKGPDLVSIDPKIPEDKLEYIYVHEMAHAIFFQLVRPDEQLRYCKVARVNVSSYASENCHENWAESVAVYFYGLESWHKKGGTIHRGSAQANMIDRYMKRLETGLKPKPRKRPRHERKKVVQSGGAKRIRARRVYRGPSRRWNPVSKWTRKRRSRR